MAFAKSNLKTALGCDNEKDKDSNGSRIKGGMPCNEDKKENVENEASKTSENCKEVLPPKSGGSAPKVDADPPFQTSKNKRRKLNDCFDDLVTKLDYNILYLNFMKLHNFIESDDMKFLHLPFFYNLKAFEEFFKMLIDDMDLLESKSLDDGNYRNICDKVIQAMNLKKAEFKLAHSYKYIEQIKNIILTVEKKYVGAPDESTTLSASNSETQLSATTTNSTESLRSTPSDKVSDCFKQFSLTVTVAFIQNTATNTKLFPDLTDAQINYLLSLKEDKELKDSNQEIQVLYNTLSSSLKILYNDYDLRILTSLSRNKKKYVLMKKIKKPKPPVTTVISQQSDNNINTNMNPPQRQTAQSHKQPYVPKPTKKISPIRVTATFAKLALTNVLEFLASDEMTTVFSPNNTVEFWFYNRCIKWVKKDKRVEWTEETSELFRQLKAMLMIYNVCARRKQINRKDGTDHNLKFHQVTFRKVPTGFDPKKISKRKNKTQLKNLININGVTENIPADVLNKRLRQKKKDKAKTLKMLNKQTQINQVIELRNRTAPEEFTSSTDSSSRSSSVDKKIVREKSKKVNDKIDRRDIELERKGKLREGLSIPVQSDKAVRMMRGMGWSGGALGARGTGIMEPITLEIDQPKGVGFGHWKRDVTKQQPIENKKPFPKSIQDWINNDEQTDTQISDTDVIVEKTKRLLEEDISFDIIMNEGFKVPKVPEVVPHSSRSPKNKPMTSKMAINDQQSSSIMPNNQPLSLKPLDNEPESAKTPQAVPLNSKTRQTPFQNSKPLQNQYENSKTPQNEPQISKTLQNQQQSSTNLLRNSKTKTLIIYRSGLQTMEDENQEETSPSTLLPRVSRRTLAMLPRDLRTDFLQAILDIFTKNLQMKSLKYLRNIINKEKRFVKETLYQFSQQKTIIFSPQEKSIVYKILAEYRQKPTVVIKAILSDSTKELSLRQIPIKLQPVNTLTDEANVNIYVHTSLPMFSTQRQFYLLKFKISLLLSLRDFLASESVELEVEFTKVLNKKQIAYVELAVESINMRVRSGSTPAEFNIIADILKNLNDDSLFITVMFNHSYRSLTFAKYCHNLAPDSNKPKEKSQTVISMDSTSDSSSGPAYKKASRPIITEADITDDDASSISEDIDLPKLTTPPGKERVNLKEYAKMYNRIDQKDNTSIAEKIVQIMEGTETDLDDKNCNIDGNKDNFDLRSRKAVGRRNYVHKNCDTTVDYIVCVDYQETVIKNEKFDDHRNEAANIKKNNERNETVDPVDQNVSSNKIASNLSKDDGSNLAERSNDLDASIKSDVNSSLKVVKNENRSIYNRIEPSDIVKIDCDVSKINLDLSKDIKICDKNAKKFEETIKIKNEVKVAYITHVNNPIQKIDKVIAGDIQQAISENIMKGKQLPLLKCHGYQDNALIYYCQSQESFEWLERIIQSIGDLKMFTKVHTKMFLTLRSYCNFDSDFLFEMLELYNKGLSTKSWEVECERIKENLTILVVKMDEASIDFIFSCNMALYAGVDKIEFTLV